MNGRRARWQQFAFDTAANVAAGLILAVSALALGFFGSVAQQQIAMGLVSAIGVILGGTMFALMSVASERPKRALQGLRIWDVAWLVFVSCAAIVMWLNVDPPLRLAVPFMPPVTLLAAMHSRRSRERHLRRYIREDEDERVLYRDVGFPG